MVIDKLGLILSGGGGKGAYQIGIFKALHELDLIRHIEGISGTSVGALNIVLFLNNDLEKAEKLWLSVNQSHFMHLDFNKLFLDTISNMKNLGLISLSSRLGGIPGLLTQIGILYKNLSEFSIESGGIFSQNKLEKLLQDNFDYDKVEALINAYDIYTTVSKGTILLNQAKPDYFRWENKDKEKIIRAILASAALPIIYPKRTDYRNDDKKPHHLDDVIESRDFKDYVADGGITDNTPIEPLYKEGYRIFIVSYLLNDKNKKLKKQIEEENEKYRDAYFIRIIPKSCDFKDDFFQTCTISEKKTERLIQLGYENALEALSNIKHG